MKLLKKAIEDTANTTEKQKNCTERSTSTAVLEIFLHENHKTMYRFGLFLFPKCLREAVTAQLDYDTTRIHNVPKLKSQDM